MTADNVDDVENLRRARVGSHEAFRALVEPFEPELKRHCYRMTGSFDDADDLVQETLFRAWRSLGTYVSHGSFRAWLYRIATNRTLDLIGSAPRRREVVNSAGEPSWLQPYPLDTTWDAVSDLDAVGLAFVVALQHLTARQRSALLLRDVLGFTAQEAAASLATTVAATNSLLQRARANLAEADLDRTEGSNADQQALVDEFVAAWRRADSDTLIKLLDADAHLTMPPHELEFLGANAIVDMLLDHQLFAPHDQIRFESIQANGEAGLATYVVQSGSNHAARHCIMLFGRATEDVTKITGFTEDRIFDLLGLPETVLVQV